MQTETTTMTRPGISWYTAPAVIQKQTLRNCIAETFDFPEIYLNAKGRYYIFMYAKHLERFILERSMTNGALADINYKRQGRKHPKVKVYHNKHAKLYFVYFRVSGKRYFKLKRDAVAYRNDMLKDYFSSRTFKYSLRKVAQLTGCDHATVIHSSKTCRNLMDTDRAYREKCLKVIEKLNNNLLILPE